jgi:hypothetical protein
MTIFGQVDSHWETHVTQSDKTDFSERETILKNQVHFINLLINYSKDFSITKSYIYVYL